MTSAHHQRTTRRRLLLGGLLGAGSIGARAIATGLPAWTFAREPEAWAGTVSNGCVTERAQFVVYATSGAGDPVNCNAPGTYDFDDIVHAADPSMAKTPLELGGKTYQAARFWTKLPQNVLDRTVFFHHGTYTNSHPAHPKVLRLMGSTARQEMLPSLLAKALAPCLGTVQVEPISAGAGGMLSFEGRGLPNLRPTALKDVLTKPGGVLGQLTSLRDATLDAMHEKLKQRGTKAQLRFLDDYALSRQQARSLSEDLLSGLSGVKDDQVLGQVTAAVTLIRMKLAPVVAIRVPFGGDNHSDADLAFEVQQSASGCDAIVELQDQLAAAGLAEQVTFVMHNVFGRTLKKGGTTGRNHWGSHHTTLIIGSGFRGGVVGGVAPKGDDYQALPIDSKTGEGNANADIDYDSTQGAMAKTLAAGVGVSASFFDEQVLNGKPVASALA